MCGRYVGVKSKREQDTVDAVVALDPGFFQRKDWRDLLDFNVPPTRIVQGIRESEGKREAFDTRFGLLPGWAPNEGFGAKTFNARVETVAEKPSFRSAFTKRRALIPAAGYYEWQKPQRTPYFLSMPDQLITFAALYEDNARYGSSFTIITAPAPERLAWLHNRIPIIMPEPLRDAWLDPEVSAPDEVHAILRDALAQQSELDWHQVDKAVGNVANTSDRLIEAI